MTFRLVGSTVNITAFQLLDLLPANISTFYRYNGSLTTPNCYESVTWTVFSDPIQVSSAQVRNIMSVVLLLLLLFPLLQSFALLLRKIFSSNRTKTKPICNSWLIHLIVYRFDFVVVAWVLSLQHSVEKPSIVVVVFLVVAKLRCLNRIFKRSFVLMLEWVN